MSVVIAGQLARGGRLVPSWLELDGGLVAAVGVGAAPRGADLVHDGVIAPGLFDLQLNGADGVDVTGGPIALERIERALLARGVTRCLATVITCDEDTALAAVRQIEARVRDPRSPIAGVHLEGPFLDPAHAGVHPAELMCAPADGVPAYYESPALRLVTLAPELPGALALTERLRKRGVAVSLGHSGASAAQAQAAFAAGASIVTHIFNAMGPLHHREPGIAGAALHDERITVTVIADGIHVDPLVLALVRRLAEARLALVSDSGPIGGVAVHAGSDAAPRTACGRLAGSAIMLDEAVRRWRRLTGATLAQSLAAASEQPARALGLEARLIPGARADLVLLDREGAVQRTMLAGRWVVP